MPSWLILLLVIVGFVLCVGLEAAMATGDVRVFFTAVKQFGGAVLALAVLGALVAGGTLLVFASTH